MISEVKFLIGAHGVAMTKTAGSLQRLRISVVIHS